MQADEERAVEPAAAEAGCGAKAPGGLGAGFAALAGAYLAGALLEHALSRGLGSAAAARAWAIPLGLGVFVAVCLAGLRARWHAWLASNRFSAPVLLVLAVLTALGTLVPQGLSPEAVRETYGWLARPILGLHLQHVFQSLGFAASLGLGAGGLALVVARRKPLTWRRSGAVLAHLGLLMVLAGGALGGLWGVKGRLDLREGESATHFLAARDGGRVDRLPLGFELRLDEFRLLRYEPDYRLMVYGLDGPRERRLLSVDPHEPGQAAALGAHRLELLRYLPEGLPGPAGPGPAHALVVDGQRLPVEPGQILRLPGGGGRLKALRAFHDFVIDAATRQPQNRSARPDNPALEVAFLDEQGEELRRTWLFARFPAFQHSAAPLQPNNDPRSSSQPGVDANDAGSAEARNQELAGAEGPGPVTLQYEFTPPAPAGGAGPVAELRLGGRNEPFHLQADRPVQIGQDRVLLLAPRGGDMVRAYLSDVSVLEDGQLRLQETIKVNHPLGHAGLAVYQSDYRPEDLSFSGFQVVRDPGLGVVYLGFVLNLLGILLVVFFPRGPRRLIALLGGARAGAGGQA
jgi:hypothetical protein